MDNARFLIAIVLAVGVIILTNLLLAPGHQNRPAASGADTTQVADTSHARPAAPVAPAAAPATAPAGTAAQKAAATPVTTPKAATPPAARSAPASAPTGIPSDTVVISSPLYRYAISSAGGSVISAELLRFRSFTRKGPVQLVPRGSAGGLIRYRVQFGDSVIDLARLAFHVEGPDHIRLAEGGSPATVRLVHSDSAGGPSVTLVYTFRPDSYRINVSGQIRGGGRNGTLLIDLGPSLGMNEADTAADRHALGYAVDNTKEGLQSQSLAKVSSQHVEEGPLYWSAFKDKYFLAAVISSCSQSSDCFGGAIANPVTAPVAGVELTTTYPLPSHNTFAYQLYLGPQEHERLAALGHDMQDVNPYAWPVFRPILQPLAHVVVWALTTLHRVLDLGYGWVLIILGVLIRLILWPFNAKAMRSQLKNMELQPRIQEIQKKYKSEPERLQKEMMRLYKEEGFNPLGGCLPMLIPYPVLITLFFVFENTIALRGVGFLWLSDLSRPDPLYILPIILGLSMFALQYLSARSTPTTNPQMKMMMWLMPPFMTFIFLRLASGLNLYYAATNLASLPQQIQIMNERRQMRERTGR